MATPSEAVQDAGPDRRPANEPIRSDGATEARGRREVSLRHLKIAGVVLPILFVAALELIRFAVIEQDLGDYAVHSALAVIAVIAVIAFSFVMFHFIERAQGETAAALADLRRRQGEGHGFYDVLLRISNREALAEILAAVAGHARDLLASDQGAVCLNEATTRSVQLDPSTVGTAPPRDMAHTLRVRLHSGDTVLGELWIGREADLPYSERDRQFLSTLSDLASIAVANAQMRESERQAAILAERERIARELHDSLAQVLGATHLRLRALGTSDDLRGARSLATALAELADVCEEGYRDVRGAILDLHESSRTDRDLLDSLRAYLDKYSHQCGIETSLETTLDHDLVLPPNSEIQIIRVIQEALTNVRKHSGAVSAAVRITQKNGSVRFVVEDDGRGFDSDRALLDRDGFGLHSMRERMELIGGTLLTESASGQGTRVVAEVPAARANPDRAGLDASLN